VRFAAGRGDVNLVRRRSDRQRGGGDIIYGESHGGRRRNVRRDKAGGADSERNLNGDSEQVSDRRDGKQRHSLVTQRRIAEFVDHDGDPCQRVRQRQ
jgi:hypothetical protein